MGTKRVDSEALIKKIVRQLDQLADPKRLEMAKSNYPTSMTVKGVAVPNIRPIVKELNNRFKKSPIEEIVESGKQPNETRILEAQQIAFELLDKNKPARRMLTLDDVLEFGAGIDNWVSVDTFAGYIADPCWREKQIPDQVVEEWAASEDRWWRRAAVV